jgi:excisionase family DNA binding protein
MAKHTRPDDLMTSSDAARILGLSSDMVRLLARRGALPIAARTIGGVRLFRREDVERVARDRAGAASGGAR